MPVSLDSSQWKGDGALTLAAFGADGTNKHGFFEGAPMEAAFHTKEMELNEGHRTAFQSCTPLIEASSLAMRVGTRNRLIDDVVWTTVQNAITADGRMKRRKKARYHRIEITATALEEAIGIQLDAKSARKSSRRGG